MLKNVFKKTQIINAYFLIESMYLVKNKILYKNFSYLKI